MQSNTHVSAHAIKNTHVACCMHKPLYSVLSHLSLIHLFSTLLITLFTISFDKSSVGLYSTFHLLFLFHIVTLSFYYSFH